MFFFIFKVEYYGFIVSFYVGQKRELLWGEK